MITATDRMVNASLTTAKYERKFSPEDVLTKIRDDGDFDRLRLKIIRQLKDDGELRDTIIDMVKQSAALNQPGAENMKPRQLSDAIHQEIGEKVMSQISNGLWKVIRSPDGIKQEVTETVQLVYNKLANPIAYGETSALINSVTVHKEHDNINNRCVEASSMNGAFFDGEPTEPPGFSLHDHQNIKGGENGQHKEVQRTEMLSAVCRSSNKEHITQDQSHSTGALEPGGIQHRAPLGLGKSVESKQLDYGSDDGPDLPPGFS